VSSRRVDIKAILADPVQRKELHLRSTAFLIAVGDDFDIEPEEARRRAEVAYKATHDENGDLIPTRSTP